MLPITHYNASESLKNYRSNAEYGVGRLELIVASGTKQEVIVAKSELEDFLRLDEILKPLKVLILNLVTKLKKKIQKKKNQ